jgi:hypothetical protein
VDALTLCDEHDDGFGWVEPGFMRRVSHALAHEGRVWLVDPVDAPGVDERVRALGEPAGVIQLLDRHKRDCALLAGRLGVPHLVVPFAAPPGLPFELVPVMRRRFWREAAVWAPEQRVLVCADALGSGAYFTPRGELAGVHPLLRLRPPRALLGLEPRHLLFGHGAGVHDDGAAAALETAIRTSRQGIATAFWRMFRVR